MRLCLGTVQFGLDYGLHGKHKPSREKSIALLNHAVEQGIDSIDTSALYGDAEEVVGAFLVQSRTPREKLTLVSKFGTAGFEGLSAAACAELVHKSAQESLSRLGTDYLDALICHVPTAVYDTRIMQAMIALKNVGLVKHIGYSVYETSEAAEAIKSGIVDFIQLPFSVLDQRMANSGILDLASQRNVILHSRSAYLQGVALMSANEVPERLSDLRPILIKLERFCQESNVSRRDLALAFVRSFPQISHLVFGAHDQRQLTETIASFAINIPTNVINEVRRTFSDIPPELVMPNKWKKS